MYLWTWWKTRTTRTQCPLYVITLIISARSIVVNIAVSSTYGHEGVVLNGLKDFCEDDGEILGKGFRIGKEMKGSTDEGGKARKVPEVHLHAHPKYDEVVVDLGKQVIKVWDASPLGQSPCRSIDDLRFRHHLSRELDMCIENRVLAIRQENDGGAGGFREIRLLEAHHDGRGDVRGASWGQHLLDRLHVLDGFVRRARAIYLTKNVSVS